MRIANVEGHLCVVVGDQAYDVAGASAGRFDTDPQAVFARWAEFRSWVAGEFAPDELHRRDGRLDAPVPRPAQVFGIGVNYADHAQEAAIETTDVPLVFPKFASCIASPSAPLPQICEALDWEVELVVVIGSHARDVAPEQAWDHVAGLTIGQDISDRQLQFAGPKPPQFGLGKSRPGFGPIGPHVVTADELDDPNDLAIRCLLNGDEVQHSSTRYLIFDVAALVSYLSRTTTLLPGDLIFTGTPAGVGMTRQPPRYLRPGDVLTSEIAGVGRFTTEITAAPGHD